MSFKHIFKVHTIVLVLLLTSVVGCIPQLKPDTSNPVRTVAILPFSNQSNNVEASDKLRSKLSESMKGRFYRVLSNAQVDQILRDELGITLGGQLGEVEFSELRSKIDADAFVFGDITHFDQTISGVFTSNKVSAKLKMIRSKDEVVMWRSNIGVKNEASQTGLGGIAALASVVIDASDQEIQWIDISDDNSRTSTNSGNLLGDLLGDVLKSAAESALDLTLETESIAFIKHSVKNLRLGPGS